MMRMPYVRFGRARPEAGARKVRHRRGAVLVMTAAAMAGLMVVTAFAVDLSRLYVLRTELQTAADAAALAAAMRLNSDRDNAELSARAAVQANPIDGRAADVDAVRIGIWDSLGVFRQGAALDTADAAQVAVSRATEYLFARFFTDGPIRLRARATAWAGAPATRAECIKPWFILHQDFMRAIGSGHVDLTHSDVRRLRQTGRRVTMTLRLKNKAKNPEPNLEPDVMYGMQLPTHYSGEAAKKTPTFRENVEGCNRMEQGWVAKTVSGKKAAEDSWPGLEGLCNPLDPDGKCRDGRGGVGVPITLSIFCTGPEHKGGGEMWFETEWMTGFMVEGGRREDKTGDFILTGYLIIAEGTGKIGKKVTGLVRTILVE
jgi:Flp pilus assembly protein TadG